MFGTNKQKQLEELSPEAIEQKKKQRSLNRIFWALVLVALILFGMLITEIITKA